MMIHDLGDESIRGRRQSKWGREFVKQNVKVLSLTDILDKTILLLSTKKTRDERQLDALDTACKGYDDSRPMPRMPQTRPSLLQHRDGNCLYQHYFPNNIRSCLDSYSWNPCCLHRICSSIHSHPWYR